MSDLADATSSEAARTAMVLVPVGSIEQHGPHLPLDTDTAIATAVAVAVAAELPGAWVAPALSYGSSGEHQSFAGTISIGTDALGHVVLELARSVLIWADRVVLVNAHGGNIAALTGAVERLRAEGHRVAWVGCATVSGDLHAGRTETSLMLHLRPGSVRLERAVAGNLLSLREILPIMREHGVGGVSKTGVLGDPTGASAEEGRRVLAAMTADVLDAVGQHAP